MSRADIFKSCAYGLALAVGLAGLGLTWSAPSQEAFPPMPVERVRKLAPEAAEKGVLATLSGVVTHNDRFGGVFLQDDTAGIYVFGVRDPALARGTRLEVRGASGRGRFAPVLNASNWTQHGTAPLPQPRKASLQDLFAGSLDSQWTEVIGVVRRTRRTANDRLWLELAVARERIDVLIENAPAELEQGLVASEVRVQGVCMSRFNERRQFLGPLIVSGSGTDLTVEQRPSQDPFSARPAPVTSLLQFVPDAIAGERVVLRGTVTAQLSSRDFYLKDETGSVHVWAAEDVAFQPGDIVQVVGFAALGGLRPKLEDAMGRRLGRGPSPQPRTVEVGELPHMETELIAVRGRLVQLSPQPAGLQFILQESSLVFTAQLRDQGNEALTRWRAGSWLRLTGVAEAGSPPRVLLRSPGDVEVLRAAPWWTLPRVLTISAVLAVLAGAAFAWVILLRRQVVSQTAVIRRKIEREAITDERTRLARELHDSLEQDLAGIRHQLEAAVAQLPATAGGLKQTLEVAKAMALRSQSEARQAVWDLRPTGLENSDLLTAIKQSLPQSTHPNVKMAVHRKGTPRPLPARVESNFLRITQEGVANALKHAHPDRIDVALAFEAGWVSVTICDDGRGFDASQVPGAASGHFGLVGLRERARNLNGTLHLRTKPGEGTTLQVRVPTNL